MHSFRRSGLHSSNLAVKAITAWSLSVILMFGKQRMKTIDTHPFFWCFFTYIRKQLCLSFAINARPASAFDIATSSGKLPYCVTFSKTPPNSKREFQYTKQKNVTIFPTSCSRPCRVHFSETPGLRELQPSSFPSSIILIIYWLTLPHQSQASLPLTQTSYNTLEEDEGIS